MGHARRYVKMAVLLATSALLAACGGGGNAASNASRGNLVASEMVGSLPRSNIASVLQQAGVPTSTPKYDAACYKLTYWTPDIDDALVTASGLVCLPNGKAGPSPIISYQHGTIFLNAHAPSSPGSQNFFIGATLASFGYLAVLPDYLGYGASRGMLHPYTHAKTLSSAIVDLLRAAEHFIALPSIHTASNGQLFLTGYSEGGYATLAAQKTIELTLSSEFTITASEPGAGVYDLSGSVRSLLDAPTIYYPAYAAFIVKAYDMIYNPSSQVGHYFQAAYAGLVDTVFSGDLDIAEVNAALGGTVVATDGLFSQAFLDSFRSGGEETAKAIVAENDIYNWKPSAPTVLFHGQSDDIVPYANATTALETMRANGSTAVSIRDCDAGTEPTTHMNCGWPYMVDMMTYFSSMAAGL